MIPGQVARRYAKALLELGTEENRADALVEEMSNVAAAYEASADLRNALANPLVGYDAKKAVLLEIAEKLQLGNVAKHTILILNDRRRMPGECRRCRGPCREGSGKEAHRCRK